MPWINREYREPIHVEQGDTRSIVSRRWTGVLLIVISAAAFGVLPILTRLAYRAGADAPTILLLRYVIAAMVMLAIVAVRRTPLPRVLALGGTVLTIGPTGNGRLPGILLALAAAVIYSGYILVGSRLMPHASAIGASTIVITAAALVYIGIVAVRGPVFPSTLPGWGAVVAIALISTVLSIVTFFAGLERVGPSKASTLSTLEPVVSVGLAILVLGEALNPFQILGGALILVAVLVCSLT